MRTAVSARLSVVAMLLALACTTAFHSARAQQASSCGQADAAAAAMRARLISTFGDSIYQPLRTALNLPTVPADSVVQVFDSTLCASAATAVAQNGGYAPQSVVYLFRAQNTYALFQPSRHSYVHYLTSSMQYVATGAR